MARESSIKKALIKFFERNEEGDDAEQDKKLPCNLEVGSYIIIMHFSVVIFLSCTG